MVKRKLKKAEKIFRFKFTNLLGKKVDRILITKAPPIQVSRELNNRFILSEQPKRGRFNLSRIKPETARRLIKKSKVRLKEISRQGIGRFNARSRAI